MNVHIDHIEGFVKLISNLYNNKHVMDNTELLSCARRSVSFKNYLEPYQTIRLLSARLNLADN